MSLRLKGTVALCVLLAGGGTWSAISRQSNYKPAKASVVLIDRKCDIIETTKTPSGRTRSSRQYNDDCKSIDAWEQARNKRDKSIAGRATVTVSYTAPQDGSYRTSTLVFTSRDDEFYDLAAGDEIDVLVQNDEPTRIRKA